MTQVRASRVAAFQRKFPRRENLSRDDLYARHFAIDGVSRTAVDEALDLVADELLLPVGLLRPDDKMADLLEPVHSKNPLRWIEEWTRAADGKAELNDRLRQKLQANDTLDAWRDLSTLRHVVRAWCGLMP